MSLPDAHTTIYCVYFRSEHMILCLPSPHSGQATDSGTGSAGAASTRGPWWTWCPGGQRAQGLTIFEAVPVVLAHLRRAPHDRGKWQDRTAAAPTVDRWTGRQQDGPDGAHRAAQRATGTDGRTGGRDGQRQRQTITEGRRTCRRLRQGIGKPLDSLTSVTGAAGVAGSVVGAVFDQVGRVTAEQPTEFVQFLP